MSNRKHIVVQDHMIPQNVMQVVQAIRDYSPELDVEWVPPAQRKPGVAGFKITHQPLGGEKYAIFHVKDESEFDASILMRIIAGDQRNEKQHISMLEAAEEAAKRVAHQRWLDELEEKSEMAHALMKTKKTVYKFNKDLIFHEDRPGNIADEYRPKVF